LSAEDTRIKLKAVLKIEKYPDGVTDEQIKSGEVLPIETIYSEDNLELTPEQAAEFQFKN
jgi:hypothetical protein